MSSLIGTSEERWSLPRAVDALAESARQAGPPGLIWIAGLVYPTLTLGLDLGWDGFLTHSASFPFLERDAQGGRGVADLVRMIPILKTLPLFVLAGLALTPCVGVALLPLFRLVAGLARLGPARAWQAACEGRRSPRLRTVWIAGQGLMLPAFGLWIQLALMMGAAFLIATIPASALAQITHASVENPWGAVVMGAVLCPVIIFLMIYALALSVLNQLALHSLAHNRRGIVSALVHGWRIMRSDTWATARAVLVDLVLFVIVLAIWRLFTDLSNAVTVLPEIGQRVSLVAKLVLIGFAGVARAGYWARAYRALGGLSPDDGVPGL